MPGDTQYDIWTDWPMHLWRNDAELARPVLTTEIANASGIVDFGLLLTIFFAIPGFVATLTGLSNPDIASCAPHRTARAARV